MTRSATRTAVAAGAALVIPLSALALSGTTASAATACDSMRTSLYETNNPANRTTLLTTSASEAGSTAGFTERRSPSVNVSAAAASGLTGVHLMTSASGDMLYTASTGELASAASKYHYTDQGVRFYASASPTSCGTTQVVRFQKGGRHAYATTTARSDELTAQGWAREGATFYVSPAPSPTATAKPTAKPTANPADADGRFSIAVYPDTQQETGTDSRFIDRSRYLVANQKTLDLRFVDHVGDVVNWDTPDHGQYVVAQKAMRPLEDAKIPYSLSIGNHDTQATGVGGGARDPRYTRQYQRDTSTFNAYFTTGREGAVAGAFEPGKVDNVYSTFEAGGKKWLVLNLELWPRVAAVEWAKNVVATHPDHNVIVSSHNLMNSDGSIPGTVSTRYGYGDASPRYVYDNLVLAYPNVKVTLSGHVGKAATRTDTGKAGNKVVSYLGCFHSNTDNPTRLIEFDVTKNAMTSKVIGIRSGTTIVAPKTQTGLAFR